MAGDPIKQAEEMLAEGVGMSKWVAIRVVAHCVDQVDSIAAASHLAFSACRTCDENDSLHADGFPLKRPN